MKKYYPNQKILLRDNLKLATVVKPVDKGQILVSYYENNKFKYALIYDTDIIEEEEYEVNKHRINSINKLLDI